MVDMKPISGVHQRVEGIVFSAHPPSQLTLRAREVHLGPLASACAMGRLIQRPVAFKG